MIPSSLSRVPRAVALALWLCLSVLCSASAQEQQDEQGAFVGERGTYVLLTAGMFVPPEGGALGGAASGEVGYQLALGPVSLSPGGRLSGFFSSDVALACAQASLRALLPLDLASPFMFGAVGLGYRNRPDEVGATYQVGGGFMISVTRRATIGAEASFTQFGGTDFNQLFLGPVLRAMLD